MVRSTHKKDGRCELLEEPFLAGQLLSCCTDPQMPHHLLLICTTHQTTQKQWRQKSNNQAKDSVQKLCSRGDLFPRTFGQVKNFGFWNCQINAQCVKKSYKHTVKEGKNSPLLQCQPLSKAWFTNQCWQVAHRKSMLRALLTYQTACHEHLYQCHLLQNSWQLS